MITTVTLNPAIDKALEVPGFHVGAHARARVIGVLPAGKGVNVARGLARLGSAAVATGFLGTDEEAIFTASLADDGVESRFCTVGGRTRTNTTILDPDGRTATHLREWGFTVVEEDVQRLKGILTGRLAGDPAPVAVFAGSLPQGLSPAAFAGLVALCAEHGAQVVVDTNGPALEAAVRTGAVATLKPNLLELEQCLGREIARPDAPEAAGGLTSLVGTVLLTLGAEGALLVREDGALGRRCDLAPGQAVNTVGCGDAFLAGWLHGEQVADTPEDALCWAVATGAAAAMTESTVGYSLEQVEALLPRCTELGTA